MNVVMMVLPFVTMGLLVFFLVRWLIAKKGEATEYIKKQIRRSRVRKSLPLAYANYSGADSHYGKVRSDGVLGLTAKNLHFKRLLGKPIDIPLSDVEKVSQLRSFNGRFQLGRHHLVLTLKDGNRVGFMLREHEPWLKKLEELLHQE